MTKVNESIPSRPVCMVKGCENEARYVMNKMKGTSSNANGYNVYFCNKHIGVEVCRYLDPEEDLLGAYLWDVNTGDSVRPIMKMSQSEQEVLRKLLKFDLNSLYGKAYHGSIAQARDSS